MADKVDGLYYLRERDETAHIASNLEALTTLKVRSDISWHRRLGHANVSDLREAERKGTIEGLKREELGDDNECDVCLKGKMTRKPFPKKSSRQSDLLDIIHSDVCGPMRIPSIGDARYYVEFIDDRSRWREVHFLKSKDEVLKVTKEYVTLVENQKGRSVKCFQTDNGGEYLGHQFDDYLTSRGITKRLTILYNPEQNGIAERKNRSLIETARCLLIQAGLPPRFWAETINAANHIRNRCPTRSLDGKTPYEVWTGTVSDVSYLRDYGSRVYCLDRKPGKGKLESRCKEGILVGFSKESKGYRIWLPEDEIVIASRDVRFSRNTSSNAGKYESFKPDDAQSHSTINESTNAKETVEIKLKSPVHIPVNLFPVDDVEVVNADEREIHKDHAEARTPRINLEEDLPDGADAETRRGRRRSKILRTGQRGRPRKLFHEVANSAEYYNAEQAFLSEVSMKQALSGPDSEEWLDAIVSEIRAIVKNDTWELVERCYVV